MVSKILHSGCAVRGVGLASRTLVAAGAPKRCGFSPGVCCMMGSICPMKWYEMVPVATKKSSVRGCWKVSVIAVRDSALLTLSAENYTLDVGTLGLGEIPTNRFSSNKHTQAGLCVYVTWCVHQVHLIVYPANVHVRGLDHGNLQYYYQRVNITQPVADAGYTGTIRCDYVMRGVHQ